MFLGIMLLLLGVLMLLQQIGVITGSIWGFFWPAVVIAIGVHLIMKGKTKRS
jgi:hypothetical protein